MILNLIFDLYLFKKSDLGWQELTGLSLIIGCNIGIATLKAFKIIQ